MSSDAQIGVDSSSSAGSSAVAIGTAACAANSIHRDRHSRTGTADDTFDEGEIRSASQHLAAIRKKQQSNLRKKRQRDSSGLGEAEQIPEGGGAQQDPEQSTLEHVQLQGASASSSSAWSNFGAAGYPVDGSHVHHDVQAASSFAVAYSSSGSGELDSGPRPLQLQAGDIDATADVDRDGVDDHLGLYTSTASSSSAAFESDEPDDNPAGRGRSTAGSRSRAPLTSVERALKNARKNEREREKKRAMSDEQRAAEKERMDRNRAKFEARKQAEYEALCAAAKAAGLPPPDNPRKHRKATGVRASQAIAIAAASEFGQLPGQAGQHCEGSLDHLHWHLQGLHPTAVSLDQFQGLFATSGTEGVAMAPGLQLQNPFATGDECPT